MVCDMHLFQNAAEILLLCFTSVQWAVIAFAAAIQPAVFASAHYLKTNAMSRLFCMSVF